MQPMPSLLPIAEAFHHPGKVLDIVSYGNGLINDTFLVTTDTSLSAQFILQKINRQVFTKPKWIMENLVVLNKHLRRKTAATIKLQIPGVITTTAGNPWYEDDNANLWRALDFIKNSQSHENIKQISDAAQVGFALGHFHRLLSDLDPLMLHDTLPGFHITPNYLAQYDRALQNVAKLSLSDRVRHCIAIISEHRDQADILEKARLEQLLQERVIHGDPKLDNFLFDRNSGLVISIIDLDTVKPGLSHYDVGDCLRSCCLDANSMAFDLRICKAVLKGYLAEAGHFFTAHDFDFLYAAIQLIPFELGLRFFTDFLQDNQYFKVTEPEQNLYRAIWQFQLMQSIIKQKSPIQQLIEELRQCYSRS
jgi:thiamine kinase-like enzyme